VDPSATDEFGVKMSNGGSGLLSGFGIGDGEGKGHWGSDILTSDLDQDRLLQELLKQESMEQRIKRGAATVKEMINPWPVSDIHKAPRAPEWPEELRKFEAERAEAVKKAKEKEELEKQHRRKRERERERERERSLARLAASKIRREREAKDGKEAAEKSEEKGKTEEAGAQEDCAKMEVEETKEIAQDVTVTNASFTMSDVTAASVESAAATDVPVSILFPGSASKAASKEDPSASGPAAAAEACDGCTNVALAMESSSEDEEEEVEAESDEEAEAPPKPFISRIPEEYPAYQRVSSEMIDVAGRRKTTDGMKQRCANLPCGDSGMGPEGPKDMYGSDIFPKRFLTWKCPADCNCSRTVDAQSRYNRIWTDMEKSIYLDKFVQYP